MKRKVAAFILRTKPSGVRELLFHSFETSSSLPLRLPGGGVEDFDPALGLFMPRCTRLIFYGHNHAFSDVRRRGCYINSGSVGCQKEAVARYVVADFAGGKYNLAYRDVVYDDTALAKAFEVRVYAPERLLLAGINTQAKLLCYKCAQGLH